MVRRGAFGLLLLCVPQILGGGDAKDRSPRRGRSVRDSAVKSADEHRSRPGEDVASPLVGDGKAEASPLVDDADYGGELTRFRVVTSAGILVIYDAAIPPGANSDNPGFVAYWNDFETEALYVFDRLLYTDSGLADGRPTTSCSRTSNSSSSATTGTATSAANTHADMNLFTIVLLPST
jgi:hypothetical protein